ncbi:MAG: hypothetical protein J7M18_05515 [Candidatus Eremiobacteraeota bacterium]|nr:hypothetical protein [Candidatus Eremiobacteraeota bacterium]
MKFDFEPLDLKKVKTYPLANRKNKVSQDDMGRIYKTGSSFAEFIRGLPDILAAKDFNTIIEWISNAFLSGKPVVMFMGAHVIKVGLSPVVIDLLEHGIVNAIATNGAGSIHDVELAMIGQTSEDVSEGIKKGNFGLVKETGEFLNRAGKRSRQEKCGLGESIGRQLLDENPPFIKNSIFATCSRLGIPITVHLTIGGDINHHHPTADGEDMGWGSFYDFRFLAGIIGKCCRGSVILLVGSAVNLPVVMEKAIAAARNLGHPVEGFLGVSMDFIHPYRTRLNPVQRAQDLNGKGISLVGHHEIMFPLLAAAVKEKIYEKRST